MQSDSNTFSSSLSIDVRICGNIPRREMSAFVGAPPNRQCLTSRPHTLNAACLAETNGSPTLRKISVCDTGKKVLSDLIIQRNQNPTMDHSRNTRQVLQNVVPSELSIPKWAVAARGESFLEPVCESFGVQTVVDLTKKRAVLFGRSPGCDAQLMHATSSRRHALLFHHVSGSCYVVDCGSAHGTYVNGKRVPGPSSIGTVLPHKVRRGSLIRFGGPGAPAFILKSFAVHTTDVCKDSHNSDKPFNLHLNTRLNALGRSAPVFPQPSFESLVTNRKRSLDSLSSHGSVDSELESIKRPRCSSPLMSPEQPLRLVSPDPPSVSASKPRRVTFSIDQPHSFCPVITDAKPIGEPSQNL